MKNIKQILVFLVAITNVFLFTTCEKHKNSDLILITYDANGGKGSMDNQGCWIGKSIVVRKCTYTKKNCFLSSWNTFSDGSGATCLPEQEMSFFKPTTLYAQWADAVPVVTTNAITNFTTTSATCGGEVIDDNGLTVTARGVCWSKTQNPTIANAHTTDGSGSGSFTSYLTGLSATANYYVRAYATNAAGTSYGEQKSFNLSTNPVATTVSALQTDSKYSNSGFYYNGHYYNYKFYCTLNFSYSNALYAKKIGFYMNGYQFWQYTVTDGIIAKDMIQYSNSSSLTITYQAFAVKYDGSYVYGQEKSLNLNYGGKNSFSQINLDLNIDENSMVSTNNGGNKISLDAPCEKRNNNSIE